MPSSSLKINQIVPAPESYSEQINLNMVMQQALQRLQQNHRHLGFIVRSETLPAIEADKKTIVKVFDDTVQMIASHPPTTRLFLYIACEEEKKEIFSAELMKTNKRYKINFYTNISTNEEWKATHQKTIEGCRSLLAQYGASFTVNEIKSTGCLFSISLLGKM